MLVSSTLVLRGRSSYPGDRQKKGPLPTVTRRGSEVGFLSEWFTLPLVG